MGELTPFDGRSSREVQKADRRIVDEVRMAARKAEGALVLGGRIMELAIELDDRRRELAAQSGGETTGILIQMEADALSKVRQIQRGLFNNWKL